eukprot:CAMPEP_0171445476 /NCGR_PEP_ID=MMETSP0881-20121228/36030_1 /TAXON_ID=67004 /ORGANISM="Thalassiosira weissflogii, Strain CCMP1336" /LENGTH=496 /DNA_ID=CAMNT_0011969493 /DNA_START=212 /DNA_END=1702 /DNA_ORIENTATION=+
MSFSRSFLSAAKQFALSVVVIVVSSQPPTAMAQEDVPGYEYVGDGYCVDAYGNYYDSYMEKDVGSIAVCASACNGIGEDGLVGFQLSTTSSCYCLFDVGIVSYPTPAGFYSVNFGYNGTEEIVSFVTFSGNPCYKVAATSQVPASSKYSTINADFGFNGATLAAGSSSSFQFEFTNSISGSTIHAAIIADTFCDDTNSNSQVKDGVTNAIGPVVVSAALATITKEVESEVAVADKNDGATTLNYCLRADLYDDSDSTFSVGAKKVDLQLDIAYETEIDFSITNIQTSEFVASSASASATRSVGIKVFRESCASGCEIVDGDASGCFAGENKTAIGDVLTLCLDAEDADVDLTGIESAMVNAADYSSAIVVFAEGGSAGTDNFVTTTSVASGQVTLETLLIPAYYDALGGGAGGSLEVSGTVLLSYVASSGRRLGRELQDGNQVQDASPFSLSIPVENPTVIPKVAEVGSGNSASGFSVVTAAVTVVAASGLMTGFV